MNLREIEIFHAVMQEGSVSLAAQRLGISQPAASKYVALLERRIGIALFVRARRRMIPTPEAMALFGQVERLYGNLTQVQEFMRGIGSGRRGHLVVATMPLLSLHLMPQIAAGFLSERPGVTLSLQTRSSARIVEWVASRQVDLGIGLSITPPPGIVTSPLARLELYCALPPGSPLEARDVIDIADLEGQDIITYDHLDRSQLWLEALLEQGKVFTNRRVQVFWGAVAMELVMRGVGISIVDRLTASRIPGGMDRLRRFRPKLTFDLNFIWPEHQAPSVLAAAFADLVRHSVDEEMKRIETAA